jgi:hypothetical protein
MAAKKIDSTSALVRVVQALEAVEEKDRQWVLQSAASKFALTIQVPAGNAAGAQAGASPAGGMPGIPAATGDIQAAIAKKDARAFIRIKKPATDVQRVACLGYFLAQTTAQHGFSSKDISKTHTDSGGSAINMTRALDNATRGAKYLSNRGPRQKQLTTLGEDVVNALPDQAAVKTVEAGAKGRRGGKKGKNSKKV